MPSAITLRAGDVLEFGYKVHVPDSVSTSGILTVSFEDKQHSDAFTSGGGLAGVGSTTGVGLHHYYDTAGTESADTLLKNGQGDVFKPLSASGVVDFKGTITCDASNNCTLVFGTSDGEYTVTQCLGQYIH